MEMEAAAFNSTVPPPMIITYQQQPEHHHHHQYNFSNYNNIAYNYLNYPTIINPGIISTTTAMAPPPLAEAAAAAAIISASNNNPWMNPRIWSRLPQQILDRILALLPPPSFFRARSVCKRWYSLLFSPSFLHLTLRISQSHQYSYFLFFFNQLGKPIKSHIYPSTNNKICAKPGPPPEAYLFDPETLKWNRLTLPNIPAGFTPSASSGGLICYVSDNPGPKTLLLHNPLFHNTTPTSIPPTLRPRLSPTVGLAATPTSLTVLLAGDDMVSPYAVKNLTTETLHLNSATGQYYSLWNTTSSLPRLSSLESRQMVYSDGLFFCMNHSPYSVLAYHTSSNNWSKIQAPMRRFLRSPTLITLNGAVVMVAAVEKSKLNVPKSLRMWKLQCEGDDGMMMMGLSSSSWVEVERMPRRMYEEFAEVEGGNGFDCVGHGEFVVIKVRGITAVNNYKGGVVFDAARKRWVWLPPCPFVCTESSTGGVGELHGFAYEPKLATPVTGLVDQLGTMMLNPNVNCQQDFVASCN